MTQEASAGYVAAILLPMGAVFLWCGWYNFRHGWVGAFHSNQVVAPVDAVAGEEQQQQQVSEEERAEQRKRALEQIFPRNMATDDSPTTKTVYVYDTESKQYVLHKGEDDVASPSCSICLEDFDSKSVVVTAPCEHSYHRPCIMSWAQGHDDCPNCRAGMWDPEELQSAMNALES